MWPLPAASRYPQSDTSKNLVDVILGKGPNISPAIYGVRTVELLDAAYRSAARGGQPVRVLQSLVAQRVVARGEHQGRRQDGAGDTNHDGLGIGNRQAGNGRAAEDADELTAGQMLAIAREMNLSETAFVRRSVVADFGARYFTPAEEIPLAGVLGEVHDRAHERLPLDALLAGGRERCRPAPLLGSDG